MLDQTLNGVLGLGKAVSRDEIEIGKGCCPSTASNMATYILRLTGPHQVISSSSRGHSWKRRGRCKDDGSRQIYEGSFEGLVPQYDGCSTIDISSG